MKKILIVFLLLANLGCFARQAGKKKAQNSYTPISVALQHTACFGSCPEYIIEVNANGILTYTGMRAVADSGVYTKKVGVKKAMEIINWCEANRIDTCKDRYENRVQDVPGYVFIIKYKSKTKTIINANFGPLILGELREKMDGLLERKTDENGTFHRVDKLWKKARP